jgi:solute carrier family 35 (UDP-sugar transporter), member A1/2/3
VSQSVFHEIFTMKQLPTTKFLPCQVSSFTTHLRVFNNHYTEILKCVASVIFLVWNQDPSIGSVRSILNMIYRGKQLVVLVILYSVANTIPFYAISKIGAPIFTVVMQLKIFATAGFSTFMLKRKYSATKWRALLLLIVGCILVSSPIISKSISSSSPSPAISSNSTVFVSSIDTESETDRLARLGPIFGLLATLIQATISGFTSVYFEALLKDNDDYASIWERNLQLSFFSICVLVVGMLWEQIGQSDGTTLQKTPQIFANWTILSVLIASLQALGGILVAGTLKHADSVLKCFATAVSIILTSIVGYLFLESQMDMFVALGYVTTVISIFNYTLDATPAVELSNNSP